MEFILESCPSWHKAETIAITFHFGRLQKFRRLIFAYLFESIFLPILSLKRVEIRECKIPFPKEVFETEIQKTRNPMERKNSENSLSPKEFVSTLSRYSAGLRILTK